LREEEHDIIKLRQCIHDLEIYSGFIALGDSGIFCGKIDIRASQVAEFIFERILFEDFIILRLEEELESQLLSFSIYGQ